MSTELKLEVTKQTHDLVVAAARAVQSALDQQAAVFQATFAAAGLSGARAVRVDFEDGKPVLFYTLDVTS